MTSVFLVLLSFVFNSTISVKVTIGFRSLILTSMNIQNQYRRPILIAVLLHAVLFCVLIFNFAPTLFRMPPSSAPMSTIHATAVSQADVQKEINTIHQKDSEKQVEARAAANEKIKKQMEAQAAVARAAANAKLKAEAVAHAEALAKKKLEQQKEAQQKQKEAQQKHLQALAQKAKAKKLAATLNAEQKKLQQALIQQQIASEQKNISKLQAQAKAEAQSKAEAQALAIAQQGAIDKYKAAILSAIQSNWHIDQLNSKLKCVYSVQLAPDGTVLSLKLLQSSGDAALDQSAQQAINVSSPLPVPSNPGLFNHFRQLILTLSPQGFLQSVSSQ